MTIEEEVLILKEVNYKENDKILHALSKTRGKIQLLSKGCRKNNSHLIHASQLFAYSNCTLFKSRDMYILTSAQLINSFYSLRNNMEGFFYGNYILELINYIAQENNVESNIFNMTITTLDFLTKSKNNYDKITATYELKLVSMLGYKPDFKHCMSCGAMINSNTLFSIKDGGFYCGNCVISGNGINVKYNEIITMDKILKIKFKDLNTIEADGKIFNIIRKYLFYHIGKDNFTTLKLL